MAKLNSKFALSRFVPLKERLVGHLQIKIVITAVLIFVLGMVLAIAVDLASLLNPVLVGIILAVGGLLLVLTFTLKKPWLLLVCLLLAGFLLYGVDSWKLQQQRIPAETQLDFCGTVTQIIGGNDLQTRFIVKPNQQTDFQGKLLVYSDNLSLRYGDGVHVVGSVLPPEDELFASFDYDAYLLRQGIVARVGAQYNGEVTLTAERGGNLVMMVADRLREQLDSNMRLLTNEQVTYVQGMILGDKSSLDSNQRSVLQQAGIMDVFAVSGLHVGYILLLAVAMAAALRCRKAGRFSLIVLLLLLYAAMTGFTASVLRATVMSIIGALAYTLGEENDSATALFVALFACLLWRPTWLGDAGLQMSFAAAAGIIFTQRLWRDLPWKLGYLAVTIAAQLAVMPLVAYYFNILTVGGLLLSPISMLLGGVVVILGFLSLALSAVGLGPYVMYLAGAVAQLLYNLADWVSGIGWLWKTVATPSLVALLVYFALLGVVALLVHYKKPAWRSIVLVVVMLLILIIPIAQTAGVLQVTFLDVGQGDAIYLQTPRGKHVLIDGGGSPQNLEAVGRDVVVPYLQSHAAVPLELMISNHPHADHAGGLFSVMAAIPVQNFYFSDCFPAVALQQRLEQTARRKNIPMKTIEKGDIIELEEGVTLTVLGPPRGRSYSEDCANEGSLSLLVTYNKLQFLLLGDLEGAEQQELLQTAGFVSQQVDVLQMPHHGSKNSLIPAWLAAFEPQAVAISVGADNAYGHPAARLIQYWQQRSVPVYRTDRQGNLTFLTDGENLQLVAGDS